MEAQFKHTPGPWTFGLKVLQKGYKVPKRYTLPDYYEIVAGQGFHNEGSGFGITGIMSESDARLIHAAPDLLRELYEAQLIVIVAKREEFIKGGASYEEAQRMAEEHHRVVSIGNAIKKATDS